MADFAKELGRAFEITQKQTEELKNQEKPEASSDSAYRGRPSRGAARGTRGAPRGQRGEFRGRGADRGNFRGQPRGGRGSTRGQAPYRGRGGYNNQRQQEEVYENDEAEISDGPEPLTQNEVAFIEDRVAENKDKLHGIVKVSSN